MRQKQKQSVKQTVKQSVIINLERRKRRPRAKGAKQVLKPKYESATVQYYPIQISYPPNPMSMFTQEQLAQKMDTLKVEILEKVSKKEPVSVPVRKYLAEHEDERYLTSVGDNQSQISVLGQGIPRERTLSDLAGAFEPSRPYRPKDNFDQFQEGLPDEPHPLLVEGASLFPFPQLSLSSFEPPPPASKAEIKGERYFDPVPVANPFLALTPAIKKQIDSYLTPKEVVEPEVKLEEVYPTKAKGRPKGSMNRPKGEIELEKKMKQLRKASKNPLGTSI